MKRKFLTSGTRPPFRFPAQLLLVVSALLAFSSLQAVLSPGSFVARGPSSSRRIALSFDDGPGAQTPQFLALLGRYGVKATFFMLGEQVKNRPLIARAVAEKGHEIGNHTTSHINYWKHKRALEKGFGNVPDAGERAAARARKDLVEDMNASRQTIETATGKKLIICRMPNGIDRPWVRDAAKEAGFVLVNWSYGADWHSIPEEELKKSYLKAVTPGAILLFHDGGSHREKSLALTEAVIKAAQEKGLEIVTVGELLGLE